MQCLCPTRYFFLFFEFALIFKSNCQVLSKKIYNCLILFSSTTLSGYFLPFYQHPEQINFSFSLLMLYSQPQPYRQSSLNYPLQICLLFHLQIPLPYFLSNLQLPLYCSFQSYQIPQPCLTPCLKSPLQILPSFQQYSPQPSATLFTYSPTQTSPLTKFYSPKPCFKPFAKLPSYLSLAIQIPQP